MFQECFTMSSYLRAIYCCALSCSAACYFQELYNLLLRAFMQHSLLFSGTYRKIMFRHFATLIRQTERIHMKDGAAGATATQASHQRLTHNSHGSRLRGTLKHSVISVVACRKPTQSRRMCQCLPVVYYTLRPSV